MSTRILIADDHILVREGISRILEEQPDFSVVAQAENGQDAVARVEELAPDIALLEVSMPRLSGVEAIRRIRKAGGPTRCVAVTRNDSHRCVAQALEAGASGYLLKSASPNELIDAVRAVRSGKSYLSPAIANCVVEAITNPNGFPASKVSMLTDREREVLQLIAEGLTSKEIAADLGVSLKTIETHRSNLMGKLNIRKASKLVRVAIHEGLVAP